MLQRLRSSFFCAPQLTLSPISLFFIMLLTLCFRCVSSCQSRRSRLPRSVHVHAPCALCFASSRGVLKMSLLQAHGAKLVPMLLLVAVRGAGNYSIQSRRSSCSCRYNTPCNCCCKCTPPPQPPPFSLFIFHSSPYPHVSVTLRSVIVTLGLGPPPALLLSCRCTASLYPCICSVSSHYSHHTLCKHCNRRSATT
jgi:hypothetical protein